MEMVRQGEISRCLMKMYFKRDGTGVTQNKMRELGNISKATGIPIQELKDFVRIMFGELLDEMLAEKK
jgi:hypothetical protein